MAKNYIVSHKEEKYGRFERNFDTFSEALNYYKKVKEDEETLEARLDIVTPFTIYIKGERENGK